MSILSPNRIDASHLRGDLFGGLTAAVVALPLALAFGVASGAGPAAGLYGAILVGFFAALFGGTPSQISGPTGPMTILMAAVVTQFAGQPALAFTVVMLAGLLQMLFGFLRLGRFVNLMPYPVISGFITGVGVILILMQAMPLLGYPGQQSVLNAITVLPGELAEPNFHSLVIGLVSLGIVFIPPNRVTRTIPATVIALVVGSLLAVFLDQAPRIGAIPLGLPKLHLPTFDLATINDLLVFGVILAGLGSIDTLLTSLVADNITRRFHNSDKELVGQGIGNLCAGLAGGIPGAGATIRTMSNVHAGGRTPVSGMVHSLILLAVALGLGRWVQHVPMAALAGILIKVGVDVIDWRFIRRMHRAPRADALIMAAVLVLAVFVNVMTAVALGVVLASLMMVKEMAEVQIESIKTLNDPEHEVLFDPDTAALFRSHRDQLMFLHLSGMMSFGAANELTRRYTTLGEFNVLIIDLLDVPRIDGSAALALEEIIQRAGEAGRPVLIVGMTFHVAHVMGRLGALALVRETDLVATRAEAVRAAVALLPDGKDRAAG